jgi:predicted DNA-binding protein
MDERPPELDPRFIRVPIGFPPEIHEWLRERAFRERRPMAEFVREAVRVYMDQHERQLTLPLGR